MTFLRCALYLVLAKVFSRTVSRWRDPGGLVFTEKVLARGSRD
jgi:hypothetical protein